MQEPATLCLAVVGRVQAAPSLDVWMFAAPCPAVRCFDRTAATGPEG